MKKICSRMLAFLTLSGLLLCPVTALAEKDSFTIGGVVPFSGAYGILGESMKRGVEVALEMRGNKVLGKPISIHWEDSETKPQPAVQKATKLLSKGADMLFGAASSSSTMAIMKIAQRRKVPLLVTISASDNITGVAKNRYTFRTSNTINMEVLMAAQYVKTAGIKSVYLVSADYRVTREAGADFKAEMIKQGIKVVAEDFPPLGNQDYSVLIDKISKSGAEGVFLMVTGGDGVVFLKQAGQVALKSKFKIFGPVLQDEIMAAAVGPGSLGINSGVRYHFSVENDANKKFVAAYRKKFGEWPNSFAGEAYDGMTWWLDVVESTKSWDKEKWIDAFEGSVNKNSVEGTKTMRACDHQALQVGIWSVVVKGKPPLPEYTMDIKNIFSPDALFSECK